jgi:hypothetical protein
MNAEFLRFVLMHIPLPGTVLGIFILLLAIIRHSEELQKFSFFLFVVSALITALTYFSGQPVSDITNDLPGLSMSLLSQYEDALIMALIGIEIAGVVTSWRIRMFSKHFDRR